MTATCRSVGSGNSWLPPCRGTEPPRRVKAVANEEVSSFRSCPGPPSARQRVRTLCPMHRGRRRMRVQGAPAPVPRNVSRAKMTRLCWPTRYRDPRPAQGRRVPRKVAWGSSAHTCGFGADCAVSERSAPRTDRLCRDLKGLGFGHSKGPRVAKRIMQPCPTIPRTWPRDRSIGTMARPPVV